MQHNPRSVVAHLVRLRAVVASAACVALAASSLAACGDDTPAADAGDVGTSDGGVPDTGMPIETPAQIPWLAAGRPPVAPPVFTPCPPGWSETETQGVTHCTPYPAGAPTECAGPDEAHFPGSAGCERIGTACAADGWPVDLPDDGSVTYVLAGAGSGGDGTRATPYASLREPALAGLPPGATIAVGVGSYFAGTVLPAGVTVVGACVAETSVRFLVGAEQAVFTVSDAGVTIRNLRIDAAGRRGIQVNGPSGSLTLDAVLIENAIIQGLFAHAGAAVAATDVIIRDTDQYEGAFGRGVSIETGATATLSRVAVVRSYESGIAAIGAGARVTLADALVDGVALTDGGRARGLSTESGGVIEAARTVVTHSEGWGVRASEEGARVALEDVLLTEGRGSGVYSDPGAITLSRVVIDGHGDCGIELTFDGGDVSGADVLVANGRDADPPIEEKAPAGICAYADELDLSRVVVAANTGVGVFLQNAGVVARLSDVHIRGTRPDARTVNGVGRGVMTINGAELVLRSSVVEDSHEGGIIVAMEGSTASLTDVAILGVATRVDGRFGYGVASYLGADTTGSRIHIADAHGVGAYTSNDGTLVLEDTVVRDISPQACTDPECGLFADTAYGVGSYVGGSLALTRFSILRGGLCGAQLALGGAIDLVDGEIRENEIGACVQVDGYDLSRLMDGVIYANDTNLEATTLPVPDVGGVGAGG